MFRLLHSDLRRVVRGRMFWVIALILVGWVALSAYLTHLALEAIGDEIFEEMGTPLVDAMTGTLTQSMDLTAQFGETLVAGGGILVMLASIFAALYAISDIETGFVKGLFPARRGRTSYYAEKFLLIALVCLVYIVIGAMALYVSLRCVGFGFAEFDWPAVARWFGVVWFLLSGYAFLAACIGWLTRSKAAGCVLAILLSTSVVGGILTGIALMLSGDAADIMEAILDWLPFKALSAVGPGVMAFDPTAIQVPTGFSAILMLGTDETEAAAAMWPGTDMPTITHVCITAGGMWLVALVATFGVAARRDV